mmetsp:Transcript_62383/g.182267  ORF Transcript_62383/g.182267 Transcript_62383/m.182267 type:complete len:409 (-) Transcript_62383:41-1267(-)
MQLLVHVQGSLHRWSQLRLLGDQQLHAPPTALHVLLRELPDHAQRPDVCLHGVALHVPVYLGRSVAWGAYADEVCPVGPWHLHGRLEVAELPAIGRDEDVVGLHVKMRKVLPVHVGERAEEVAQDLEAAAPRPLLHVARQRAALAVLQQHIQLLERVHDPDHAHDAWVHELLEHPRLVEVLPDLAHELLAPHALDHDLLAAAAGLEPADVDGLEGAIEDRLLQAVRRRVQQWSLQALPALEDLASKRLFLPLLHHQLPEVPAVVARLGGELRHLLEVALVILARDQQHVFFAKGLRKGVGGAGSDVAQDHDVEHLAGVVGAHGVLCRGTVQRELTWPQVQLDVDVAGPPSHGGGPHAQASMLLVAGTQRQGDRGKVPSVYRLEEQRVGRCVRTPVPVFRGRRHAGRQR